MSGPAHLWFLAGVYALLIVASVGAAVAGAIRSHPDHANLVARIRSWWVMVTVFSVALLMSRGLFLVFAAFLSFLAFKEYLSIIPTRRADRRVLFWAYLAIPVQYWFVFDEYYGMFIIWIPVYVFLFLPLRMIVAGETEGFLRAAGTLHWGLMVTVFTLSHLAFLMILPGDAPDAGAGLVIYVVLLTQIGDVAQYVWGKLLGRRKLAPRISPGKTVAGLVGGVATTGVLSILIAPLLTPLSLLHSAVCGVGIGLAGFAGDIVISALKRDLRIKDSGSLLPGHGGILDRIDSLTYTSPLFFHFVRYFYY